MTVAVQLKVTSGFEQFYKLGTGVHQECYTAVMLCVQEKKVVLTANNQDRRIHYNKFYLNAFGIGFDIIGAVFSVFIAYLVFSHILVLLKKTRHNLAEANFAVQTVVI